MIFNHKNRPKVSWLKATSYRLYFNMILANEPTGKDNGTGDMSIPSPPEVSLAHELKHFILHCEKWPYVHINVIVENNPLKTSNYEDYYPNDFLASEIHAVEAENIVRSQLNLTLRTHYQGQNVFNTKFSGKYKKFYSIDDSREWYNSYYCQDKGDYEKQKLLKSLEKYKSSNIIFSETQYNKWYKSNFKVIIKNSYQIWGLQITDVAKIKTKHPKSICISKK